MEAITVKSPEFLELTSEIDRACSELWQLKQRRRPGIENEVYFTGNDLCRMFHINKRTLQDYRDKGMIP